jgi:enolase
MKFTAATPVGTSAGTDEAVHLIDSIIESSPIVRRHLELFERIESTGSYRFAPTVKSETLAAINDNELAGLWMRAMRYGGRGCLNAVSNVEQVIAPRLLGRRLSDLASLADTDRELLALEVDLAIKRGKLRADAPAEERIRTAQRKANLGMNAMLAVSLALGRLIAARDGKELPEILHELEPVVDREQLYGLRQGVPV